MTPSSEKIRSIVLVGVFSAVSYLIMLFGFSILPGAPFLKLDFSEIPVLLVMFVSGPVNGIIVELIKNILHYGFQSSLTGIPIDQFANFVAGLMYTMPLYYFYKRGLFQNRKGIIISISLTTLILVVGMSLFNYFILLPSYYYFAGLEKFTNEGLRTYLMLIIVPFNIIKAIGVSLVFVLLYPKVKTIKGLFGRRTK